MNIRAGTLPPAPVISVLMPVYNRSAYLREAVDSILQQDFTDFEFIIVDDCSTEDIASIVNACNDPRIRLVRNEVNSGVARSLNRGLQLCRGEYVVRMDSDDIALPGRLASQLRFMREHPAVVASGSALEAFGSRQGLWQSPLSDQQARACLLFDTPLYHPTAIVRRQVLLEHNIAYNENIGAEDYDFWYQLSKCGQLANLPDCLLRFRIHQGQTGRAALQVSANRIRQRILAENFGITTKEIPTVYAKMFMSPTELSIVDLRQLMVFFCRMEKHNQASKFVDSAVLKIELLQRMVRLVKSARISRWEKRLMFLRLAWHYPLQAFNDKIMCWR